MNVFLQIRADALVRRITALRQVQYQASRTFNAFAGAFHDERTRLEIEHAIRGVHMLAVEQGLVRYEDELPRVWLTDDKVIHMRWPKLNEELERAYDDLRQVQLEQEHQS